MTCKQCGAVLPDESAFCPFCMADFQSGSSAKHKKPSVRAAVITASVLALVAAVIIAVFWKPPVNDMTETEKSSEALRSEDSTSESNVSGETEQEEEYTDVNGNTVESWLETDEYGETYAPGIYKQEIDGEGRIVLSEYVYVY